ncbi:hypothetical protein BDQ12DRAFT_741462 [Crucibulum laeve]|uniref:Uncharacterized protein n=1 Tax=Crucibulum laeve TaxID=68775 RepID=A0A5C3MGH7_9AGAR|nr:hypothetical protein BDQ12DRAFT_741462 [Crucibulum laeve]
MAEEIITKEDLDQAIAILNTNYPGTWAIIGGCCSNIHGSNRPTADIDIIVERRVTINHPSLPLVDGKLHVKLPSGKLLKLDVILEVNDKHSYEDLSSHISNTALGAQIVDDVASLGLKLNTYYRRPDNREGKRESDLDDIVFYTNKLLKEGRTLTLNDTLPFQINCYNFYLIRKELRFLGEWENFLQVGGQNFEKNREEHTQDELDIMECVSESD